MRLNRTHFRFGVNEEELEPHRCFYVFQQLPAFADLLVGILFKCLHLSVGVSNAEAGSRYDSQMKEGVI